MTLNFKLPLTLSYLAEAPEKRNCMSGLPIGMLKKFYQKFSVELETGGKLTLFAGMCREGSGYVFICAMKCPIDDCCGTVHAANNSDEGHYYWQHAYITKEDAHCFFSLEEKGKIYNLKFN